MEADRALETACAEFNKAPDHVFLCAGFSKPQLFIDATPEDLQSGLNGVYWVSAWTAHAAVKKMVKLRSKGTITFVSSFLGYSSFAGYSPYAPGKFALRGGSWSALPDTRSRRLAEVRAANARHQSTPLHARWYSLPRVRG